MKDSRIAVNDETLILHYYDELPAGERAAVEAALAGDGALADRYRALRRSLERFDEPPRIEAPPHLVARWHRSIDRAAGMRADREHAPAKRWHLPSFAWGALAAAVFLAALLRFWYADGPVAPVSLPQDEMIAGDPLPAPAAVPVSFSRGLKVHLRESRQDLMRLEGGGDPDRRLLLTEIVRQNRQFERAALDNNADDVARVLRAFEPVLIRLASDDISAEDAAALQSKLLFELDVMLTKIAARESHDEQTI